MQKGFSMLPLWALAIALGLVACVAKPRKRSRLDTRGLYGCYKLTTVNAMLPV